MAVSEEDVPNFNDTLQGMYQEDEDENPHNNQIIVKTIVVVTFVLVNIGNAMLMGVIHFEKYGQDPMKRSFPDRMFANCCWLHVYISFTNCLIEQYRALIGRFLFDPFSTLKILDKRKFVFFSGPVGMLPTWIVHFNRNISMISFPLAYAESVMYKCLLIFNWKKCAAIDDDFWGTFMSLMNISFGMLVGSSRLALGNVFHEGFKMWSGLELERNITQTALK